MLYFYNVRRASALADTAAETAILIDNHLAVLAEGYSIYGTAVGFCAALFTADAFGSVCYGSPTRGMEAVILVGSMF